MKTNIQGAHREDAALQKRRLDSDQAKLLLFLLD